MTTSGSFQRWRRLAGAAQGLLWLGLPFVYVGGESALRLDVPAGRLHALGASFAIDEAFVVLAATLLLTAAFLLVTLLYGRVWCGWSCPQTVLGDLTRLVERARGRRGRWRRPAGFAVVALVSAVAAASLLWYFVSPYEFFRRLAAGTLGPVLGGGWLALAAVLFADLAFVRETFCATVCPYAKLQGVLFDRHTLVVAYDRRRAADCVDCGACVRVCPTGIDIRAGPQMECIACAACVDACAPIMAKLQRGPNLVGYFFGEPGTPRRLARPGVLALAGATAAALAVLVAVVAGRAVVDVNALAEPAFAPRRASDGRVVNAYSVALENHGRAPVTVGLALRAGAALVAVRPEVVELGAGERRQVRLVATAQGLDAPGRVAGELVAEVRRGDDVLERRAQELSMVVPEDR
ncbi:4Fe-4S dicluster domain-containing protein [Anaeromyxobacter sp. Fw109-5]|uniref:4Fe-4S dicluster domain-containing protein n=1 Tax=Anaeromyxobacter sp. (strain Fw109-5) TaxID=404589 RepID=UPI0000ED7FA5|nr:4Fe-4S dicluster domain-containing protein [Anaeromyxobacter sp. Fw109-5]ABS25430.1 4Fe-4S ferredoxin iron-sulfur binding domain protein [Anaeromyxobacter sp. Fw109-5]